MRCRARGDTARNEEGHMTDVIFIAVAVVFFAVCVAYVRGLDRIVRRSEESEAAQETLS
jgi:hypothetical protein